MTDEVFRWPPHRVRKAALPLALDTPTDRFPDEDSLAPISINGWRTDTVVAGLTLVAGPAIYSAAAAIRMWIAIIT